MLGGIAPFLAEADLSLCNLETPLAPKGGPYRGYPMFTVPQEIVPALKAVGYDGCTTASNHSMDGGVEGVIRTLDALKDAGHGFHRLLPERGDARKPLLTQAGGAKVAVIAGTYSLNGVAEDAPWRVDDIDEASLVARARAARAAGADIVLAAIHDGAEYTDRPTAGQRSLYRALADSGEFDFIYSHHTHSVLPIEKRGEHLDRLRVGQFRGQARHQDRAEPRGHHRQHAIRANRFRLGTREAALGPARDGRGPRALVCPACAGREPMHGHGRATPHR